MEDVIGCVSLDAKILYPGSHRQHQVTIYVTRIFVGVSRWSHYICDICGFVKNGGFRFDRDSSMVFLVFINMKCS